MIRVLRCLFFIVLAGNVAIGQSIPSSAGSVPMGQSVNDVSGSTEGPEVQAQKSAVDDLEFLSFESPDRLGCDYVGPAPVTVAIRNNGTTLRTNFDLTFRIFSRIITTETVTDTVLPGGTLYHTFDTMVNISSPSIYAFSGWIANNSLDVINSNDSILLYAVYVGRVINKFPYLQTFDETANSIPNDWYNDDEESTEDWMFDQSANGIDGDNTTGKGYMAFVDNSSPHSSETNLLTPCVDLDPLVNPYLEFYLHNTSNTNSIVLYVDVLSNGTWNNIAGPLGLQPLSGWNHQLFDLNSFAGEVVKVRFRGSETTTSFSPDLGIDDVKIFNWPAINASIDQVNAPQSDCALSNSETINVDISHSGYDTLHPGDTVFVSFQLDGGAIHTEPAIMTSIVRPFESFNYQFTTPVNLSALGEHTLKVWTTHPLDDDPTADTVEYTLTNAPFITQFPYVEDFESGPAGWEHGGESSSWAFGKPNGALIQQAASGQNAWGTGGLHGLYNNNEQSYLLSPCFDFSSLTNPQVAFDIWYDCQTGIDGAAFQYSLNNGQTWNQVGNQGDEVNWYNDGSITSRPGGEDEGWSGYFGSGSNTWVNAKHFLPGLGGEPQVRFRIAFSSNVSINSYDGVAIDNFVVGETPALSLPTSVTDCGFVTLDAGTNADLIYWSTGDSSRVLTIKSGQQSIQQSYHVYIEDAIGLYNRDTTMVDLAPGPYLNFGPDTVVCGAGSLVLDTEADTSATVTWFDGSSTIQKTVNTDGQYYATVSESGCTKSDTIEVRFEEFPVANFGHEQESGGRVVTFSDSSAHGDQYHWDFGDGFFSGIPEPQHFFKDPGTYEVMLIVSNGCGQDTLEQQVVVEPRWGVGINSSEQGVRSVYPNPASEKVMLEIGSGEVQEIGLEICNMQGQSVVKSTLRATPGVGQYPLSLTGLSQGVYLIKIHFQDGVTTVPLVKQ